MAYSLTDEKLGLYDQAEKGVILSQMLDEIASRKDKKQNRPEWDVVISVNIPNLEKMLKKIEGKQVLCRSLKVLGVEYEKNLLASVKIEIMRAVFDVFCPGEVWIEKVQFEKKDAKVEAARSNKEMSRKLENTTVERMYFKNVSQEVINFVLRRKFAGLKTLCVFDSVLSGTGFLDQLLQSDMLAVRLERISGLVLVESEFFERVETVENLSITGINPEDGVKGIGALRFVLPKAVKTLVIDEWILKRVIDEKSDVKINVETLCVTSITSSMSQVIKDLFSKIHPENIKFQSISFKPKKKRRGACYVDE